MTTKFEELGIKLWEKGNMKRYYINLYHMTGLTIKYYKTGNISDAFINDERISNSEAYRMKAAKTYYDVTSKKLISTNKHCIELAAATLGWNNEIKWTGYQYEMDEYVDADDEDPEADAWDDGSDIGCGSCPENECTGHCMSCPYRSF